MCFGLMVKRSFFSQRTKKNRRGGRRFVWCSVCVAFKRLPLQPPGGREPKVGKVKRRGTVHGVDSSTVLHCDTGAQALARQNEAMPTRLPLRRAAGITLVALTLAACSNAPSRWSPMSWWSSTPPKPATLTRPVGSLCLAEIAAFATERTGYRVTLTDSAFANSADLVVPLTGLPSAPGFDATRSTLDSESFQLALDGKTCKVGHARTRETVALRQCDCAGR
jgi:hypothetical protein